MKSFPIYTTLLALILPCFFSCEITQEKIDSSMLDGDIVFDSTSRTISDSIPNPTPEQLNRPVIIAVHGFSATTFEWQEFRDFCDSINSTYQASPDSHVLVSQVLLGGHGLTYDDFKNSTWQGWQDPIVKEYQKLRSQGYQYISLAGSSTGGALILDLVARGFFKNENIKPKSLFLIDPIVLPSEETLYLIDIVGGILGNSITDNTDIEKVHWYTNRPAEALQQLMDIVERVRKQLEAGYKLPVGTQMVTYKAKKDDAASPMGALLIKRGVRTSQGKETKIVMVNTNKHVFTRLKGRKSFSTSDIQLQRKTFLEIRTSVLQSHQ